MQLTCVSAAVVSMTLVQAAAMPIPLIRERSFPAQNESFTHTISARDSFVRRDDQLAPRYDYLEAGKAIVEADSYSKYIEQARQAALQLNLPKTRLTYDGSGTSAGEHLISLGSHRSNSHQSSSTHSRVSSKDSTHVSTPVSSPSSSHRKAERATGARSADETSQSLHSSVPGSPQSAVRDTHRGTSPNAKENELPHDASDWHIGTRVSVRFVEPTGPLPSTAHEGPTYIGGQVINAWPQRPLPSPNDNYPDRLRAEHLQWYLHEGNPWLHVSEVGEDGIIRLAEDRDEHLHHLAYLARARQRWEDIRSGGKWAKKRAARLGATLRTEQEARRAYLRAKEWARGHSPRIPGPRQTLNPPNHQAPPLPDNYHPNDAAPGRAYPGVPVEGIAIRRTRADKLGPVGMPFHRDGPMTGFPGHPEFMVKGFPWPKLTARQRWTEAVRNSRLPTRQQVESRAARQTAASGSSSQAHDGASTSHSHDTMHDAAPLSSADSHLATPPSSPPSSQSTSPPASQHSGQ